MLRPRHIAAAFAASLCFAHSEVVISEFVAENDGHLLDVDGASSDWIELYNNGAAAVSLSGWFLSDDSQQPFLWPLPAMTLNAGERRVIFASGKDRRNPAAELHTNFSLKWAARVRASPSRIGHLTTQRRTTSRPDL